jgi:opacity protein-like surface antigen
MKQLITAVALALAAITAQAADYQEVREFNGNAQQIIAAANKAMGAVKTKNISGDVLTVQTKVDCMSGLSFLPVAIPFYGDIIIEAKDGRYRITFDNMKAESGYTLAQLPQNKESCEKSFKEFSQQINKKMTSFTDF